MCPQPIRVLMIEDSQGDAEFVKLSLGRAVEDTFLIEHVTHLGEGVRRLGESTFDVVLLDLGLPDAQGMNSFKGAYNAAPHVPIILMTSNDDLRLAREALREGAQDYMLKQKIDVDLLERSIRYSIERKRALEQLRESQERYALAVQGANDAIWDWDLRANLLYLSSRWKVMLGYEESEISTDPKEWFTRIHPDYLPRVISEIEAHKNGASTHFESEYLLRHKDGSYRWVQTRGVAVRAPGTGEVCRMAGSHTDITERKAAELRLRHEALHDSLTNLPNRALLWDHLSHAIAQTRRRKDYRFGVLFIDLDRFKIVNDSLGHSIGDQLLVSVARRLEKLLRSVDTLARLGGDEYVLLLENINDVRDATRVADRILHELEKPFYISGNEIVTGASIGIALSMTGYDTPEHVLRDADTAMYRAKARGRGCHEVFDQAMHQQVSWLMKLETDLRRAVDRKEFIIHYQPIVSLESGKLTGFEALVRWQHPERGLVGPPEFIHLAEETGLIVPMGGWVLRESCRQLKEWQEKWPVTKHVYMAVNLSSRQLCQPNLPDQVRLVLEETALDPQCLKLELTETMIMETEETILEILTRLKSLGVRLLIDDFGTGYSSLNYLHRFPIDNLKIDRSFISRMNDAEGNMEIVRTIINLAGNLQLKVIAEGVETPEQMSRLKEIHVEEAQGFFFSRPLDSASASHMLLKAPVA